MAGSVAAFAPIAISAAGSLFGGSSAPSAPGVNVYQPTGTGQVDTNLQNLLSQNYNLVGGSNNPYSQYASQFRDVFNQQYNNPYQQGAQNAANQAGAGYNQVGQGGLMNSTALQSGVNPLLQGAGSVMQMGLDPQKALYDQLFQRTNDQANVTNAQYGLTGQQAAGNVQQADTNFNIDWQNQELQRAIAGLNAGGQASTAAGALGTAGQNIGSAGAGAVAQGGQIPYEQSLTGAGNQSTALQQYIASLLGPQTSSQQTISDLGAYLGQGISASEAGQQASLADYAAQLQGAQMGGIGGYALGQGFSNAGGFNFLNPSSTAQLPWQQPGFGNAAGQSFYGGGG